MEPAAEPVTRALLACIEEHGYTADEAADLLAIAAREAGLFKSLRKIEIGGIDFGVGKSGGPDRFALVQTAEQTHREQGRSTGGPESGRRL